MPISISILYQIQKLPHSDINKSNLENNTTSFLLFHCLTVNLNSLTANESKGGGGIKTKINSGNMWLWWNKVMRDEEIISDESLLSSCDLLEELGGQITKAEGGRRT